MTRLDSIIAADYPINTGLQPGEARSLVVEVLSEATEAYDRGKKFEHYRQIPSFKAYLLVSQWEPRIEQFTRQTDGQWLWNEAAGLEAMLEIPSLRITISLAKVFMKVKFIPAPIRAASPPA